MSRALSLLRVLCALGALCLCSCAHRRAAPRETARLTAALHRGDAANERATQHAARIGTDLERIDAKDGVILQWLDAQP